MQRRTITKLPKHATTNILTTGDIVATEFQKTACETTGLASTSNLCYQVIDTGKEETMDWEFVLTEGGVIRVF